MSNNDLHELIRQGEGAKLEFKRDDVRPESLAREIVAFANSNGGKILMGVEDDGAISGIQRDDLQRWVVDTVISRYMSPLIYPEYEEVMVDDKKVAIVTVRRGPAKPYVLRHNDREDVYLRLGNTCQLAQREQILRLFEAGGLFFMDKTIIQGCRVDELDENRIKLYFTDIIGYNDETWESEKEMLLRNHQFIDVEDGSSDAYVTFFACIFFAKNPRRYLPQAGARLLVFSNKREDGERDFVMDEALNVPFIGLDNGQNEEMHLTSWVMKLLKPHISREHLDAEVSHQRQTHWHYPPLVLREVIINAFAHRDWTKQKQIEIAVYADCLEITSPGALPNGMTIDKMKVGERTPRNSKMQRILQDFGFSENHGMGIRRRVIPEMLKENGCEPIFEATEDYFRVILPKKSA